MTKPETLSDILPPYGPCWLFLPTRWKPSLPSRGAPWSTCTAAARGAYTEVIAISQASGNSMVTIAATTYLGQVQEADNQLSGGRELQARPAIARRSAVAGCLRSVSWPG